MGDAINESPSGGTDPIRSVSIVLPIFNEEECIEEVVREIVAAVDGLEPELEILMVDDGSEDATREILTRLDRELAMARYLPLPRNMGQSAAMLAGMRFSKAGRDCYHGR